MGHVQSQDQGQGQDQIMRQRQGSNTPTKVEGFERKQKEKFGTDLGWFGGDLGMVWGYFRDDFGPILKIRKIESSELNN